MLALRWRRRWLKTVLRRIWRHIRRKRRIGCVALHRLIGRRIHVWVIHIRIAHERLLHLRFAHVWVLHLFFRFLLSGSFVRFFLFHKTLLLYFILIRLRHMRLPRPPEGFLAETEKLKSSRGASATTRSHYFINSSYFLSIVRLSLSEAPSRVAMSAGCITAGS